MKKLSDLFVGLESRGPLQGGRCPSDMEILSQLNFAYSFHGINEMRPPRSTRNPRYRTGMHRRWRLCAESQCVGRDLSTPELEAAEYINIDYRQR